MAICWTMYNLSLHARERTDLSESANGIRISHQDAGLKSREWDKDFGLLGAELSSYGCKIDTGVRDDV
jgi:hypothetical protein